MTTSVATGDGTEPGVVNNVRYTVNPAHHARHPPARWRRRLTTLYDLFDGSVDTRAPLVPAVLVMLDVD